MKNSARSLLGAALAMVMGGSALAQDSPGKTIIVLDASGSMWGQIEGVSKIEIAKKTIAGLLQSLDPKLELGLVAYGHRREGDCEDIELLIKPGKVDRKAFLETVMDITPKGKTPLTASVEQAAQALAYAKEKSSVILVSDGLENCDGDLCALAKQLEKNGVDFTAHVVAFDLAAKDAKTMECLSKETGGQFLAAQDAEGLKHALETVVREVVQAGAKPEPPAQPAKRDPATLEVPAAVPAGKRFPVKWTCKDRHISDFITIVPKGTEEREWGNFTYVGKGNPLELLAPIKPGPCEVRYLAAGTRETLARAEIEVQPISATVSGPDKVGAGSAFPVEWTGPDNKGDYITIVAKGAEEGSYTRYKYAMHGSPCELPAPVAPGAYELRYVTGQKGITLARAAIEVTPVSATVQPPAEVVAGSKFEVKFTGPSNKGDYITIVPKGAPDKTYKDYDYTKNRKDGVAFVKAPIEPGEYEVRYITGQKATVLAKAPTVVKKAEVAVSAPDEVTAGAPFPVEWVGPANQGDFITIVAKGAPPKKYNHYAYPRTAKGKPVTINALESPGAYEVRYIGGGKILASTDITLTEAKVELEAPAEVMAGAEVEVAWTQSINPRDFITVVPKGTPEGKYEDYFYVSKKSPQAVTAPEAPGEAEVRYITTKEKKTLASRPIKILPVTATLKVAARVAAGQEFNIEWTGPNNKRDYITLVKKGSSPNTSGTYYYAHRGSPGKLRAPAQPGEYELRYMTGKKTILAKQEVSVVAE